VCSLVPGNIFLTGEMKMNTFRRYVPAFVLGLTMAVAGVGFAQNPTQGSDTRKMESCCCCGDSCAMKDGEMKSQAMSADKHKCCGGDSCAMKDGARKTANASDKHEGCCSDDCSMAKKDGMNNHATPADKDGCCCGDSCNMKHDAKMSMTNMKHDASADKHACCCCGDSCDMKDMKAKP
jgi:hypothetical protein